MTPDERIDLILLKIQRAKKHLMDVNQCLNDAKTNDPVGIGVQKNADTQRLEYYITNLPPFPAELSLGCGDVIHNVRSALDQLAYHLVDIGSNGNSDFLKRSNFPIAETEAKYQSEGAKKIKGLRPDAISAIDALKPYGGGNDLLWKLHDLDRIDKHRKIILVGMAHHSVDVGTSMTRRLQELVDDNQAFQGAKIPPMPLFLQPSDRQYPLKVGDVLFSDLPDAEPEPQMAFAFEVAFGESGTSNGEPILSTLNQMVKAVEDIVPTFKACLT